MLRSVYAKTLRDALRGVLWWSAGLVGLAALIAAVFPTVRDNPDLNRLAEQYPDALKAFIAFGGELDFTSGAGYLGSELFSFMIPLLLLVAAIGAGARAIAGEEERGTLELLLANPVSRARLVLEKLGALATEVAVLAAVLWGALVAGGRAVDLGVPAGRIAAATASAALLALAYGAIALLLGAATGRRSLAVGVSAAAAVAAYLVSSLALLVEAIEPARHASPFFHYSASDPLRQGLALDHAGFLVLLAALAAALAPLAFERRDLRG